jgi:hypothetical protein
MTDVSVLGAKLELWLDELLHKYGKKHPYTALARIALYSGDEGVMQDAITALYADESLREEILGLVRQSLLDTYTSREPTLFRQFKGSLSIDDEFWDPDDEGHYLTTSDTWELMPGDIIRVLVSQDTAREHIPPLIQKLAAWITEEYSKPAVKHLSDDIPL